MAGFTVTAWDEIQAFYEDLIDNHGFTSAIPMLKLVRSVIAEGAVHTLAAHTSMHDLVVTTAPVSASPDWLRVSLLRAERIRIGHESATGPGSLSGPRQICCRSSGGSRLRSGASGPSATCGR